MSEHHGKKIFNITLSATNDAWFEDDIVINKVYVSVMASTKEMAKVTLFDKLMQKGIDHLRITRCSELVIPKKE